MSPTREFWYATLRDLTGIATGIVPVENIPPRPQAGFGRAQAGSTGLPGRAPFKYRSKPGQIPDVAQTGLEIDWASPCPDESQSAQSCPDESHLGSERARCLGCFQHCTNCNYPGCSIRIGLQKYEHDEWGPSLQLNKHS